MPRENWVVKSLSDAENSLSTHNRKLLHVNRQAKHTKLCFFLISLSIAGKIGRLIEYAPSYNHSDCYLCPRL